MSRLALNLPIRSGVPAENALDVIDAQVHNSMFAHMSGLGNTLRPSPPYDNGAAQASNWRKDSIMSDATMVVPPMHTMQQMQEGSNPQTISTVKATPSVEKVGRTKFEKCPEGERMHCLVVDDDA
jgi:hypothetical protein